MQRGRMIRYRFIRLILLGTAILSCGQITVSAFSLQLVASQPSSVVISVDETQIGRAHV